MPVEPALRATVSGEILEVTAVGDWIASRASEMQELLAGIDARRERVSSLRIDYGGVSDLDTYGAWLIERTMRRWRAQGGKVTVASPPPRLADLLGKISQTNAVQSVAAPPENWAIGSLARLGERVTSRILDLSGLLGTLGAVGEALVRAVAHPRQFRFTSTVHHLDRVCWQAVPIVALITFLIGCIIAQQGFFHFRKFGADDYVVDLVAILTVREIGVLIVAIMVAGRSGSSYTAELGSMKMREEIDALRTMGLDPIDVLILPRVLALIIALPMLTFLGAMAALYGGGLVAWLYGGMSPSIFIGRLQEALSVTHFQVGMIKAPFMALIIGAVACDEGLKVKGSAESLGLQTTTSVVKSIFLVIVLDGLFAMFFASIGM
ncbi:MAG: phospholipid/cholesterol/gamma-HCH transport system permease protein [Variibacter sp.]|nr:phospholipid/cholesterol/gamma-HCH transport system permease protein [Variibacter sp.]